MRHILNRLPESLRTKALFRLGLMRVPMMGYIRPRLVELSANKVVVRVDLSRRTRNMYTSMFLGAFTVAADCVAGVFPVKFMLETGHRVPPIVKTSSAEYYKRLNSYAHFTCTQGDELTRLCKQAVATGQRLEASIDVLGTAPQEFGDEPVAIIKQWRPSMAASSRPHVACSCRRRPCRCSSATLSASWACGCSIGIPDGSNCRKRGGSFTRSRPACCATYSRCRA